MMYKNKLQEHDIFLTSSSIINEICNPLKKIGISYITYLKNFDDGSQINLSNSAEWIEHYYKFKLHESSLFEKPLGHPESRYFIWPTESNLNVFQHGRNYFDSDHGITMLGRGQNYCEFFFFSGSQKNAWLTNFYINNLDILEKFVVFFKEKLHNLIKKAENSRILIPQNPMNIEQCQIENVFENEIAELKQTLCIEPSRHIQPLFKRNPFALLSEREMDIANCLLNGNTAKETARTLLISYRTVERHLENIKTKLSCRTKFELVNKLLSCLS